MVISKDKTDFVHKVFAIRCCNAFNKSILWVLAALWPHIAVIGECAISKLLIVFCFASRFERLGLLTAALVSFVPRAKAVIKTFLITKILE